MSNVNVSPQVGALNQALHETGLLHLLCPGQVPLCLEQSIGYNRPLIFFTNFQRFDFLAKN